MRSVVPALVVILALVLPGAAAGQDGGDDEAPEVRWRNTAELSYLTSQGNSTASTLGLRNTLRRDAPQGDFRVDMGLLRTDAVRTRRRAVGSPDNYQVEVDRETERTAERYSAEARYDWNLGDRAFASGSAGWQRNTFSGFRSRAVLSLGGGSRWGDGDEWELKLGAGITYTFQEDVEPDPDRRDRFGGVRITLDHDRQLTSSTAMEVKWVVDANAEDRRDVRGDLSQSVSAALTDRLALKTTLQLVVDNDPPLIRIPLESPDGTDTGETVVTPLRKLDRVVSVALVVTL